MSQKSVLCINLFQPWADAAVDGRLPVLARRFPISRRGRVGIAATEGMDGVFLELLTDRELTMAEKYLRFGCAIGSVKIDDCLEVTRKSCWKDLEDLAGRPATKFYPAHMMPRAGRIYFWVLSDPRRFRIPVKLLKRGITWSRASLTRNMESREIHTERTFWSQDAPRSYIRLNDEIRRALWAVKPMQ